MEAAKFSGQFTELDSYVPVSLRELGDLQTTIPAIARDEKRMREVEEAVRRLPTTHRLVVGDAREIQLEPNSVHLAVTSPPYWTLKNIGSATANLAIGTTTRNFSASWTRYGAGVSRPWSPEDAWFASWETYAFLVEKTTAVIR